MTTHRYTPEAIAALVAAAQAQIETHRAALHPTEFDAIREALHPFTSEPSSWRAFCREMWGEHWGFTPDDGARTVSRSEYAAAATAYRERYGVEPF